MTDVRQKFETWAAFDCLTHEFERNEDGTYVNEHVQSMWIGYEAANADKAASDPIVADYARCLSLLGVELDVGEDIPVCLGDMVDEMVSAPADNAETRHTVPNWLSKQTFAIQHNPNCPSRYLVRMVGFRAGVIDLKSYYVNGPEGTKDALGFGNSIEEAGLNAKEDLKRQEANHQKPQPR